jgi:hypothetical protein
VQHAPDFDAFVSYNHEERATVSSIKDHLQRSAVRCWIDYEQILGGESTPTAIVRGLDSCPAALVCLGPNGWGRYQKFEVSELLSRAAAQRMRVIPVVLPGGDPKLLGEFLFAGVTYVQFLHSLDAETLQRLVLSLASGAPATAPRRPAPALDEDALSPHLHGLASAARARALTLFIGSGFASASQRTSPPRWELGAPLLQELGLSRVDEGSVLPPPDLAAFYYAARHSRRRLEDRILDMLPTLSGPPTEEYVALGDLLRQIGALPWRRSDEPRPVLVVTTNFDLLLERALLHAGVTFTRLVVRRESGQMLMSRFDANAFATRTPSPGFTGSFSGHPAGAPGTSLDEMLANAPSLVLDPPSSTAGSTSVSHLATAMADPSTGVVLLKFHGSLDVGRSWTMSTDDLLSLATRAAIPQELGAHLARSGWLFLGYELTDIEFLHVRHTLLRSTANHLHDGEMRLFVCDPEASAPSGVDPSRQIVRNCLRPTRVRLANELLGAVVVEEWEGAVLRRLSQAVASPA